MKMTTGASSVRGGESKQGAQGRLRLKRSYLLRVLALSAGYALCAKVGLLFAAVDLNVSPVWPGAGIALAALFLGGKNLWPGIAIGSLAADLTGGVTLLAATGNASANSAEAVVGVLLLARLFKFSPTLRRTRDPLSLAAVSLVASLVGAAIGVGWLVATGSIGAVEIWDLYRLWWIGDATGCFLFAPLIFVAFKSFSWTWLNGARLALGMSVVGVVTYATLFHYATYYPFAFILLVALLTTLALRQIGAVTASVTVCAVSLWVLLNDAGNPANLSLSDAAIHLQAAIVVVAATGLLVASLLSERDDDRTFLEAVLENLDVGVVACDSKGTLSFFNRASRELHNLPAERIPSEEWADHYDLYRSDGATPLPLEEIPLYRALRSERVHNEEIVIAPKDGEPRTLVVNGRSLKGVDGMLGAVVAMHDVTERRKAETALSHQALHDPLTDLPNRLLLSDRLEHALAGRRRSPAPLALLVLDLDRFKAVNDSIGHEAGDQVLVTTAGRLRASLRASDTVARLSGDEFAILLANTTRDQAFAIATQVLATIRAPIATHDRTIAVDASIGIIVSEGEDSADELLRNADHAMYAAKTQGGATIQVFEPFMHDEVVERLSLETELRGALARHQFSLHYQPLISLVTGKLTGFEALVRWNHPERGLISPATFIPLAETTGLIVPLGEWVLRTACLQASHWQVTRPETRDLTMHVNISVHQLQNGSIVDVVSRSLTDAGLRAQQLVLEITESVVMHRGEALAVLDRLHGSGVRLAIDDFGTGYSSLGRLHSLPIDKVKIDKSLVDATAGGEPAPMVAATIAMAHSLGLETVAEGVESAEQLPFLRLHGCDEIQGYLFGRPVDAATVDALLRKRGTGVGWTDLSAAQTLSS